MKEIPDFRTPDDEWIISLIHLNGESEHPEYGTVQFVMRADLEKLGVRFGLEFDDDGGNAPKFKCELCKRRFVEHPWSPFEYCSALIHDQYYAWMEERPNNEDCYDVQVIELTPDERHQRDLLVRGIVDEGS